MRTPDGRIIRERKEDRGMTSRDKRQLAFMLLIAAMALYAVRVGHTTANRVADEVKANEAARTAQDKVNSRALGDIAETAKENCETAVINRVAMRDLVFDHERVAAETIRKLSFTNPVEKQAALGRYQQYKRVRLSQLPRLPNCPHRTYAEIEADVRAGTIRRATPPTPTPRPQAGERIVYRDGWSPARCPDQPGPSPGTTITSTESATAAPSESPAREGPGRARLALPDLHPTPVDH